MDGSDSRDGAGKSEDHAWGGAARRGQWVPGGTASASS